MSTPFRFTKLALIATGFTASTALPVQAESNFRQHEAHVHGVVEMNIAQDEHDLLMEITAPGADVIGFEHAPQNDAQHATLSRAVATLKQANNIFTLPASANCSVKYVSVKHSYDEGEHEGHHHDHDGHDHDKDHHDHDKHDHGKDHHDHDDHDHDKGHHDHDKHDHGKGHHDHDKHDHDKDHHGHDDHDHDHHGHDHGSDSGHAEFSIEYHYHCDDIKQLSSIQTHWFELFSNTEKAQTNILTEHSQKSEMLNKQRSNIKL